MTDKTIVIAYDGSPSSSKALELAVNLAKSVGADLKLVTVIEQPASVFTDEFNIAEFEQKLHRAGLQTIASGEQKAQELGLKVESAMLAGNPAEEILNYALKVNAYMIVVGTRGLGGFQRLLVGSVAQALVAHSQIPVFVCK